MTDSHRRGGRGRGGPFKPTWWERLGEVVDELVGDEQRLELAQAKRFYQQGDDARVEQMLRGLLDEGSAGSAELADEPAYARTLLGLSQLRQRRLTEAEQSFERAIALRDDDVAAWIGLAHTLERLGNSHRAVEVGRRALKQRRLDTKSAGELYGVMGRALLSSGDADRAVRELRKAAAIAGDADLQLLGQLGLAQVAAGNTREGCRLLGQAVTAVSPDPEVVRALATVSEQLGRLEQAELAALRLTQISPDDAEAYRRLARSLLARGKVTGAQRAVRRALELGQESATLLLSSEAHLQAGEVALALDRLESARMCGDADGPSLLEALVRVRVLSIAEGAATEQQVLATEQQVLLKRDAEALLADDPEHPLALAGSAIADPCAEHAEERIVRSLQRLETFEGFVALATVAEAVAEQPRSLHAWSCALRVQPDSSVARRRLVRQVKALLGPPQLALRPNLSVLLRLLEPVDTGMVRVQSRALPSDTVSAVAQIRRDVDEPLVVAVMGEFNSGKSTFVNALIGRSVAPMGVTPTTVTINVFRYGRQPGARVLLRDGGEQGLAFESAGPFLQSLDTTAASKIRQVEMVHTAQELRSITVVDTPGINAMTAEHAAAAREIIAHADAVVWLFSADQAGKQTEQRALQWIREHHLKTVGVVNKIDRLAEGQLAQVLAHLRQGFGDLLEEVVAVSAREALRARLSDDRQALRRSGFGTLSQLLERKVYASSRTIKTEVARRRLLELLERVAQQADRRLSQLDALRDRVDDTVLQELAALRGLVGQEQWQLHAALQQLYEQAAEEILDFVQPRRYRLGSYQAEPADRDYLRGLLLQGYVRINAASQVRLEQRLTAVLEGLHSAFTAVQGEFGPPLMTAYQQVESVLDKQRALLHEQVYGRFEAYSEGYMAGGYVDEFFANALPDLDLQSAAVVDALRRNAADADRELLGPLDQWIETTRAALVDRLRWLRAQIDAELFITRICLVKPTRELLRRLQMRPSP